MKRDFHKMISSVCMMGIICQFFGAISLAAEESADKCKSNLGPWKPTYRRSGSDSPKIIDRCKRAQNAKSECQKTLDLVDDSFNSYNKMIESSCQKIAEDAKKIAEDTEHKTQFEPGIKHRESNISGYQSINAATENIINSLIARNDENIKLLKSHITTKKMDPKNLGQVNILLKSHESSKKDRNKLKEFNLTGSKVEQEQKDASISGFAMPATQSFELVKALLDSKDKFDALIVEDTAIRDNLVSRNKGLNQPTDNNSPSGISGFDPSSLLSLAPLAAMLAQKPPSTPMEDPSSNITPATPPERAPSGSLVKGDKSGESKKAPLDTPKDTAPEITPSPYADAFTGAEDSASNISKPSNGSGSGGAGGNAVSGAGGGGLGGTGSSENSGSKGRSTAALPANAEEALQSFNSGGGLNYAGAGSGAVATDSANDPMKDMLNEMETAVEGSFDSNLDEGHTEQGSEIAVEDSESLFPRVRACHVRALKKGLVINGLGEKLSELDE